MFNSLVMEKAADQPRPANISYTGQTTTVNSSKTTKYKHSWKTIYPSTLTCLKAQLDGAWLGSFYVITDVIDKESYSNAPCIRPGAAQLVIGRVRLVGSPQKRFFSRSSKGLARAAVAATRGLQSTRQASRRRKKQRVIPQAEPNLPEQGRWSAICRAASRRVAILSFLFRSVGRASDVTSLDEPRAV
jgi:hypothetical protein